MDETSKYDTVRREHCGRARCVHCSHLLADDDGDPSRIDGELTCWRCVRGLEYEAYERACELCDELFSYVDAIREESVGIAVL